MGPRRLRAAAPALALAAAGTLAACDSPVAPEAPLTFVSVSAGGAHTCGLDGDGRAWCWGANGFGQLGISDGRASSATPLAVNGPTRFRSLTAGSRHTCGLDGEGRLWCWGANESGQLGDGTHRDRGEPRPVPLGLRFAQASAGSNHTCAAALDGRMWCWGRNDGGQLGNAVTDADGAPLPVAVEGDLRFSSAAAGERHTCGLALYGGVLCWGANAAGELGAATEEPSSLPVRVAGTRVYRQVSAGAAFSCGVVGSGEVLCWGSNARGELGLAGFMNAGTPSLTLGSTTVTAVRSSPSGSWACASTVGGVFCWGGRKAEGAEYRLALHQVHGLPGGVVNELAVGRNHACAVVGNEAWCWGEGSSGQLGDGAAASSEAPVKVGP